MASSLTCGQAALRMQATVPNMQRERVWNSVTRRSVRVVHGSDGAGSRRTALDDGVPVVCFLALVGVVVVGGLLMLFAWVTAPLPLSPRMACAEFGGCVVSTPDETQAVWADDRGIANSTMIP